MASSSGASQRAKPLTSFEHRSLSGMQMSKAGIMGSPLPLPSRRWVAPLPQQASHRNGLFYAPLQAAVPIQPSASTLSATSLARPHARPLTQEQAYVRGSMLGASAWQRRSGDCTTMRCSPGRGSSPTSEDSTDLDAASHSGTANGADRNGTGLNGNSLHIGHGSDRSPETSTSAVALDGSPGCSTNGASPAPSNHPNNNNTSATSAGPSFNATPSESNAAPAHPGTPAANTPPAAAAASATKPSPLAALVRAVSAIRPLIETVALLALWYASNIFYNIYNKQVLSVFPHATTCTVVHLVVAIVMLSSLWLFKLKKVPRITERTVQWVFPLGILHLAGFMTTNMSLGAVNVSLTHTIKSLEPFFTVLLSFFFFGTLPALPVLLTLVPIVMGVIVASATDLSFNWYGFLTAMGSNLAFQSRNVLSKKYMVESSLESLEGSLNTSEVLDEVDLFLCISVMALPMAIPFVMAIDGPALTARFADAGGDLATRMAAVMPADVFTKNLLAGACRTADVFASYGLLSRLNPVTHSVANCVKRVVVIAVSILFFKTQSSYLNILGTVMALSGVFAYSMAERKAKKAKLSLPGQKPRSMATQLGDWSKEVSWNLTPAPIKAIVQQREEAALAAKEAEVRARLEKEAREKEEQQQRQEPDYFL